MEKERKQELVRKFSRSENDVGSPEVQIAIFTERIRELTEHFAKHPKDTNSKKGFFTLIGKRRKLLRYLKNKDYERYQRLISELGLRK
ncbi:30S ribosomal protein S15 [bacterium]|nr:MAG: 30S ribosomal protein S15 [bacterium]